jgi:hypothetical protein
VSFYSPDLNIDIYRVEKKNEVLEATNQDFWQLYPEFRIAKSPGIYTFRIAHQKYSATFKVEVRPDMISYVSVNEIMLNVTSSTSHGYNSTTTTTNWEYNISVTVGAAPLPVLVWAESVAELVQALHDGDWGTRLFAIKALRQAKLDPGQDGTARLEETAATDRKREVREAALDLLNALGAAARPEPVFLETFDDNGRDWLYGETRANLQCYFDGLGYNMDNGRDNYVWNTIPAPKTLGELSDYDVEVEAVWKGGIDDNAFGFLLGSSVENFYDFCVSRNGGAISHRITDSRMKANAMDWNNDHGADLKTADSYRFKLEVRGNTAAYSVNGFPFGTVTLDKSFSPDRIGLIVYFKQNILFRSIRITAR